ncbi:MAG: nicotinamide-nucleotide adenylyltransferase [Nanoarchaeota archaeon]
MTTGLFVGRFQPFHKAHLVDIKNALKVVDTLIILIGSSQYSHTPENPFTAEERKLMIKVVLNKENIKRCSIFSLADINEDNKWVQYLERNLPKFEIVFTGNPRVMRLFKETKHKVKEIKLIKGISGTRIRKGILGDKNWKIEVPKEVAKIIGDIHGVNRINLINIKGKN